MHHIVGFAGTVLLQTCKSIEKFIKLPVITPVNTLALTGVYSNCRSMTCQHIYNIQKLQSWDLKKTVFPPSCVRKEREFNCTIASPIAEPLGKVLTISLLSNHHTISININEFPMILKSLLKFPSALKVKFCKNTDLYEMQFRCCSGRIPFVKSIN